MQVLAEFAGKGRLPRAGSISQRRVGIANTEMIKQVKGDTKASPGHDGGKK